MDTNPNVVASGHYQENQQNCYIARLIVRLALNGVVVKIFTVNVLGILRWLNFVTRALT